MAFDVSPYHVVSIGLGGIWEGYGFYLPYLFRAGELPTAMLSLVDGDAFEERNRDRQTFAHLGAKAEVRRRQLLQIAPDLPARSHVVYVHRGNVGELIPDGSIVLLSPDNHPTRRLVSDHVKGLDSALLLCGGNDAIDEAAGTDGTAGEVMVHYRKGGGDLTAPIDRFHPEITNDSGREPTAESCGALVASGALQVRRTNLLVGQTMLNLLLRYVQLPDDEACTVGEVAVNVRTGMCLPYARSPDDR